MRKFRGQSALPILYQPGTHRRRSHSAAASDEHSIISKGGEKYEYEEGYDQSKAEMTVAVTGVQ